MNTKIALTLAAGLVLLTGCGEKSEKEKELEAAFSLDALRNNPSLTLTTLQGCFTTPKIIEDPYCQNARYVMEEATQIYWWYEFNITRKQRIKGKSFNEMPRKFAAGTDITKAGYYKYNIDVDVFDEERWNKLPAKLKSLKTTYPELANTFYPNGKAPSVIPQ